MWSNEHQKATNEQNKNLHNGVGDILPPNEDQTVLIIMFWNVY